MTSLSDELGFLNRFAAQIKSGRQRRDGTLARRAGLYVQAARNAYERVRARVRGQAGATQMRRVLHANESCEDCVDYAAQGWVEIGALPMPGDGSQCGRRCLCTVEYR